MAGPVFQRRAYLSFYYASQPRLTGTQRERAPSDSHGTLLSWVSLVYEGSCRQRNNVQIEKWVVVYLELSSQGTIPAQSVGRALQAQAGC